MDINVKRLNGPLHILKRKYELYHQIRMKSTNGQAKIITERETNDITIGPRPCRVQRGAPLDHSSWSDLNLRCFWVTEVEPLRLDTQFNLRNIPKTTPDHVELTHNSENKEYLF